MKYRLGSILALAMVSGAALAQSWMMGYSGGAPNYLDLTFADGSTYGVGTDFNLTPPAWLGLNQGWWAGATYTNSDANDNTFCGNYYPYNLRNFFTFDLRDAPVGIPLVAADLRFPSTYDVTVSGDYKVWDVSTNVVALNVNDGANWPIFIDLGTGNQYASLWLNSTDDYVGKTLPLNGFALADITPMLGQGYFSVGGTFVETPEPASLLLLGVGLAVLARRRR